jgi:hypothetical protein
MAFSLDVSVFISSGLVQFLDRDGLRLASLQAKLAQDAFIFVLGDHFRRISVSSENTDRADPNASAALSDADAGGHVDVDPNEFTG